MIELSKRLTLVPTSPIRKLVPYAVAAKKQGVHVYHLNIGDPDIQTPECMLDVLRKWDRNPISYGQSHGEPKLLDALVTYYHGIGFSFVTTDMIQVTTGGSEAISMALFSVASPGDEILVFEPFYANYNAYAVTNGLNLVPVPTTITDGFHLPDKKIIESYITAKTKAILICTPNNPTGTVYTQEEMSMLVGIAKEKNLFLLSDEVYREFTYDGKKQVSLLSFMSEIPDLAIVLDSLSKRYSLCGARLGALVSRNEALMVGVLRLAQAKLSSGLIDQLMASELIHVPASYIENVQKEYEERRNVLFEGLKNIPGVTVTKPEGAFYIIASLPIPDAEVFATYLLTTFRDANETVMVAPAAGFYATPGMGKNEIRIAYVLQKESLIRCIELLTKALESFSRTS